MNTGRCRTWPTLLMIAGAAGCAGNGQGLDQNGQPISQGGGAGTGVVTADFQSIQDNVFTPICSKCHIGASAPEGLQLDAAHSYNLLVGVPSNEQPALLRVKPSDPDDSYMVRKIEGLAGITGGQMPLGQPPLPQATITAIRQWITDGAPNSQSGASAVQPFAVQATEPAAGAAVIAPLARVVLAFSEDLDAALVNDTTIMLERMDSDTDDTGAPSPGRRVPAAAALASANAAVIVITPRAPLEPGDYRVSVRGTGGAPLASLRAVALGADLSFRFTVEAAR